jgi:peptidyl-prolyl cis-trans isomerase C
MKQFLAVLALALPGLALAQLPGKEPAKAPAAASEAKPAAPATGPVATVNGVAIPRSRMDTVLRIQRERGVADNEQVRAQIREILINNELLNQEANRSGLVKRPEFQAQLELNPAEVIANAQMQEFMRVNPVAPADVQKEYDRLKAQTAGEREYKARHILVASEAEANAVLADLKKGVKFEEIAQKRSLDEGTRPRGGEFDWTVPAKLEKAFADAMVKLEKGRTSETAVRTRHGFHIVRLDDTRQMQVPDYEQIRSQLQQRMLQQKIETYLRDLRAKARIE